MKPMIYDGKHESQLLHYETADNGEQIVVLDILGDHLCAYVSVPKELAFSREFVEANDLVYVYYDVDEEADEAGIYVHGGFTYGKYGKPWDIPEIKEAFWLGWDYGHLMDYTSMYAGYALDALAPRSLKKWTTEEVVEEARQINGHIARFD